MIQALNLPKKVYFKAGCTPVALRELGEIYHCSRALLVTDPELYRAGIAAPVVDLLRKQGIRAAEFFTIGKRVSFVDLRSALPKLHEFQPDVIVGVGGNNAMSAAKARGTDVVLVDTAGRLHNKANLMKELAKLRKIIDRELPGAAKETLLVLDATTGQNGLIQARQFKETAGLTGIVLTKLDGTAKGGIVIAIAQELQVPVKYVGLGEGIKDLAPFDAKEFVGDLF